MRTSSTAFLQPLRRDLQPINTLHGFHEVIRWLRGSSKLARRDGRRDTNDTIIKASMVYIICNSILNRLQIPYVPLMFNNPYNL